MYTTATTTLPTGTAMQRVKTLFLQSPGEPLSVDDASHLAGIDTVTCRIFLDWLRTDGVLERTPDGRFIRRPD